MFSHQIDTLLNNLISPDKCNFLGVFPRDLLPTSNDYPHCFVANNDTSDLPGRHWLAFYNSSKNDGEFFDSFAYNPVTYGFNRKYEYSEGKPIQAYNSEVCGHYCIYFLYNRSLGHTYKSIVNSFLVSTPEYNDILVRRFIRKVSRHPTADKNHMTTCPAMQCNQKFLCSNLDNWCPSNMRHCQSP